MAISVFSNFEASEENSCAILWFPTKTHVELEVNDRIYNLFCGARDPSLAYSRALESVKNRALSGVGAGYYRIQLKLEKSACDEIVRRLSTKSLPLGTCSGSIGRLLNQEAKLNIPILKAMVPEGFIHHFWNSRNALGTCVEKVELFVNFDANGSTEKQEKMLCDDIYKQIKMAAKTHSLYALLSIGAVAAVFVLPKQ